MRLSLYLPVLLIWSASTALPAAEDLDLEEPTTRINYSLGYQIGGDFKRQGVEMDPAAVVKGIEDALSGAEPLMPPGEMNATLMELKRQVVADQRTKRRETELRYLVEGKKFLEENAKRPGVKTTPGGLQYEILEAGTGKTPGPTDQVTVNYRGTLINGNEFDSSYKRGQPATFRLNGVIKGWAEGLQLIREGGKIRLFIPPELAYGERGPLAHRTLVFDVELLSVGEPEQTAAPGQAPASAPKTQ